MDAKYKIIGKYEIDEDIYAADGKLFIPIKDGFNEYSQLLCDNTKTEYILPVYKEIGRDGKEKYVVDFTIESPLMEDLWERLQESEEGTFSFALFLVNGLECSRICDIRKEKILIEHIIVTEKNEISTTLGVYFNSKGNVNLLFGQEKNLYRRVANIYLKNVNQEKNKCLIFCESQKLADLELSGAKDFCIVLQASQNAERHTLPITSLEINEENEKRKIEFLVEFDLEKMEGLFSTHWNFYVCFELLGEEYSIPIEVRKKNKKLANLVLKQSIENYYQNEASGNKRAYLNITKAGRVRIYTGDLNNASSYGEKCEFEELIRDVEVPFSKELSAKILEAKMGSMKFQLLEASLEEVDEIALLVYKMASVRILSVPVTILDAKAGVCEVNTDGFKEICDGTGAIAYKFGVAMRVGNRFMKARLLDKRIYVDTMIGRHGVAEDLEAQEEEHTETKEEGSDSKDGNVEEHAVYMDNIFTAKVGGEIVEACPYTNHTGFILMRMCLRKNMSIYKIACEALKINVSSHYLTIQAKCPDASRDWEGFMLSYRYQKEEDKDERYFKADTVEKTIDGKIITAKIPLDGQEFKGIYWNIRPVYIEDGERCITSIKALKSELKESYKKLFQKNCKYYDVGKEKYILFPYVAKNGNINLMYRTTEGNDGFSFRVKERMGLRLYQMMEKRLKKKKIMLIYEKYCYMAGDNGYQLFKYCMENDMEKYLNRKIYYVIDKKSPDYEKVKKYDKNVLDFMSVKFIAYMLAAKLLVSSDVRSHAYAWRHRSSIISHVIQKKKHIFLQHGVTAMKKVDNIFGKSNNKPTNLFIVTSDEEYEIVSKYFGYNKNEIALTGFARWDVLEDKSQNRRDILLMPTWRNWLDDVDSETFRESDYYKNYMQLLNSERLKKILADNDATLKFYIHPKFKDYIGNFHTDGERIQLIPFGSEPLNELMMECNMLITDYSSVSWDVYYMKKPVLFYQFDIDTYNKTHGSYMDMEHDLFGDRTLDLEELISLIEENIKNQFKLKPKYEEECKKHFKYMDQDNCKRICSVIKQKGY